MGCASSKPVKGGSDVLVRVRDEQPSPAPNRQSVDDAYCRAASLEIAASDDSVSKEDVNRICGPDGYELVGQLGNRKTGALKLMRNRRTKELLVARCLLRECPTSEQTSILLCFKDVLHRCS